MKKTWIKLKRGLLTPEHREKLGVRVWLYMYMLDRADWDTGIIYGWKDKDEARDFGMNWRTLQQQRQQLETDGYISCEQKPHYQNITIHNWTNPREYSGEQYNTAYGGTEDYVPTDGDTKNRVPSEGTIEGTYQGTNQGTNQGIRKPSTPTYSPQTTDHNITESEEGTPTFSIPSSAVIGIISQATGMVAVPPNEQQRIEQIHSLIDAYGVEDVRRAMTKAFKLWTSQKRQDGRGYYRRTNFGWVDWAQEELAGGGVFQKDPKDMNDAEFKEWLREQNEEAKL